MDYDYLSSIISNYSNLTSLTGQGTAAASGATSVGDSLSSIASSIAGTSSFSNILDSVMKSGVLNEDTLQELTGANADEDAMKKITGLAGVQTNSALESEARSNLIMQNYLYAALMKDTLENTLTDKADYTTGLFTNLATGGTGTGDAISSYLNGTNAKDAISSYLNSDNWNFFGDTDSGNLI